MNVNEFFISHYGKATAMELHERLVAARKNAGFASARDAAEALGVPYPTYAGHENGSSGFRADRGELYARRFKVSFEWLMRGKGPCPAGIDGGGKKLSDPAEIREFLQRIDGLLPDDVTALLSVIDGFRRANAARPSQSQPGDQSEPATPRRESTSSR